MNSNRVFEQPVVVGHGEVDAGNGLVLQHAALQTTQPPRHFALVARPGHRLAVDHAHSGGHHRRRDIGSAQGERRRRLGRGADVDERAADLGEALAMGADHVRAGRQLGEVILAGAVGDRERGRTTERRDDGAVHRRSGFVEDDAVDRTRHCRRHPHHRLLRSGVLAHLRRGHRRRQADHRHRDEPGARCDHGELHGTNDEPVPRGARGTGPCAQTYDAALTLKLTFRVSTLFDVLSVTLTSRR